MTSNRPSWDEYFLNIMNQVAARGTCDRGRSGCVIVKDKQILTTGYVGAPPGLAHCDDVGHHIKKTIHEDGHVTEHCVRTTHAEQNAICQAAKRGISIEGSTLYIRMTPCRVCSMLIISCGVARIVCERKYHVWEESHTLLDAAGVSIEYVHNEIQTYTAEDDKKMTVTDKVPAISGASYCDRCGEVVADNDAGFSPGLAGMWHHCGGQWQVGIGPDSVIKDRTAESDFLFSRYRRYGSISKPWRKE